MYKPRGRYRYSPGCNPGVKLASALLESEPHPSSGNQHFAGFLRRGGVDRQLDVYLTYPGFSFHSHKLAALLCGYCPLHPGLSYVAPSGAYPHDLKVSQSLLPCYFFSLPHSAFSLSIGAIRVINGPPHFHISTFSPLTPQFLDPAISRLRRHGVNHFLIKP